jgi:hypothetical protein
MGLFLAAYRYIDAGWAVLLCWRQRLAGVPRPVAALKYCSVTVGIGVGDGNDR